MKIRTLLLLMCFLLVLSQFFVPNYHVSAGLYSDDPDIFQPIVKDLQIPDLVSNTPSPWYTKIEGSAVAMLAPDGFLVSVDSHGFDKNRDTSINIVEERNSGFSLYRKTIASKLAQLDSYSPQDVTLLYSKDFRFDGYDATALYLYDRHNHLTYIFMAFGDEHFSVTMRGTCHAQDTNGRDAIISAMLTASYDRGRA